MRYKVGQIVFIKKIIGDETEIAQFEHYIGEKGKIDSISNGRYDVRFFCDNNIFNFCDDELGFEIQTELR